MGKEDRINKVKQNNLKNEKTKRKKEGKENQGGRGWKAGQFYKEPRKKRIERKLEKYQGKENRNEGARWKK